uniref:RRM domain-containing protein n=1 Tax=Globodera pallida TaxID=36090 RepID=A0A183BVK0_GLOPA
MSYTFPGGARRPIIDINSENLVFIWNLPRWIDIGDIKRSLQPKYGRIKFVETFEAWRDGKRMGQIILDFATSSALSDFARAISSKEEFSNYEGVEFMRFDPKSGGVEEVGREKEASFDAVGGFGSNPPSRRFSRPKLSFLDEPNGTTNRSAVGGAFGVNEICPEDPEVDAAFGAYRNDDNDEAGTDSVHQQEGQEQKSPSSNDGEEAVKPGGRHPHMDTSFTQYREKSRSREDSVSEDLDGRGSVKNTLKITQLDAGFDITKILEALQTVGEVVYHDRVGKTSAAFTFDDAAEAANASVWLWAIWRHRMPFSN